MSDIALDTFGDVDVSSGTAVLNGTGLEAIRQALQIKLRAFREEWFLDLTVGVPWFQSIFDSKIPALAVAETVFRDQILSTPGVLGINSLTLEFDGSTRQLTLTFSAQTTAGVLDFSFQSEV